MTAVTEYEQDLGIRPGTFCAYEVEVAGIVDLVDPSVREGAGVSDADLLAPWKELWLLHHQEPPGWPLQDRLLALDVAGLCVPSARDPRGVNLVLWRWNDVPRRHVTALDPSRDLPHDTSSWPS